jgi:hypothetical protein
MNSNSDASKNNRGLVINHLIDQAFNLALLGIGIICTVASLNIVIKYGGLGADRIGDGGVPLFCSIVITILTLVVIIRDFIVKKRKLDSNQIEKDNAWLHDIRIVRWLTMLVMAVLFVLFVDTVSFIVGSFLFLFVIMIALGRQNIASIAIYFIVSLGITLIIYYSYTKLLHITVPGAL